MKISLALLAAVATATPHAVVRDTGCCFGITAYAEDGPRGPVGQLSDGQNRIGQANLPLGKYCIENGGLIDGAGRGCILTPPTTQWQCDVGAAPTPGFSVGCNGTISHDGDDTFFSCPTGDHGAWNIYSQTLAGEPLCIPIWLEADSCHEGCPPPPPPPPAPVMPTPPPVKTSTITAPCPTETPKACPGELTGNWEFPHLIIPINSAEANTCMGNGFNGTASGSISTIFNFDIPQSYAGMTCSLEFLFPTQDQLETSAYEFSGDGQFEFAILEGIANKDTTYATAPKVAHNFGTFTVKPGTAVELGSCPDGCPAGQAMSFWMSPVGDSSLNYFQDSNPCPIGLYVTAS